MGTREEYLVILGGFTKDGAKKDTLINYNIDSTSSTFTQGPALATTVEEGTLVRIGYDLYLMGYYFTITQPPIATSSPNINKLSCSNKICTWETISQKFKLSRHHATYIPVPNNFDHSICLKILQDNKDEIIW